MAKSTALFYDFFQVLRSRGWELGWEQYELFLRGFILSKFETKAELLNFCKTVWLSRPNQRGEFEELFEYYYAKVPAQFLQSQISKVSVTNTDSYIPEEAFSSLQHVASPPPESSTPSPTPAPSAASPPSVNFDTVEVALNIDSGQGEGWKAETPHTFSAKEVSFIFSEQKHIPFTVRKTAQNWRKMRVPTQKRTTNRLDVSALVQQIAREGIINKLPYHRQNVGTQQVIWFSDHGGSMLPYEVWEKQLLDIVRTTPNIQRTEQYFFHDYPSPEETDFKFFTNRSHTEVKTLSAILKNCTKQTAIVFFSDAGAARRRFDTERLSVFLNLINTIKNTTQRLVWLNPVKNTTGTAADYLAFLLRVHYPSNDELKRLILEL